MIAPAGPAEAAALAALHAGAMDKPWSEAEIASLLANSNTFALLARGAGPLGFAIAWAVAGESELLTVAVAPSARRRGAGAALVAAAGVAAFARGAHAMHLEVAEDNAPARALYAKLGFEITGKRAGYYAGADGAIDAILMRKTLAAPAP